MFIAVGLFGLFAYTYSTTKVNSAEIQSLKNSQYAKTPTSTRSRVSSSSNLLDTQVQGPAHFSLNTEPSKKSTIPDYASGVN